MQLHDVAVLTLFVRQAAAVGDQHLADLQGAVCGGLALFEGGAAGGVIGKAGSGGAAQLVVCASQDQHLVIAGGADLRLGDDAAAGALQLDAVAAGGGKTEACGLLAQEDHPVAVRFHDEVFKGCGAYVAVGENAAGQVYLVADVVQLDIIPVFTGVVGDDGFVFGADLRDLHMIFPFRGGGCPGVGVCQNADAQAQQKRQWQQPKQKLLSLKHGQSSS